ncbi:Hypothetical protein FKW44_015021 [Caligus rogercresseyi]|uniref:Uncharacterized protein n=1 Tax=Caligus rogercresseyi TaxID=217165 RepID=A0A7T8GZQ0_CALRO|nr:Hypothetical protein FKW44_015021 [Caligus rogercresseyi]
MRRELYRQPSPKSFTLSKQFLPLVWKQKEHFPPQEFLTKLRSCLDDRSLDTLCMLRHFFLHNKK